MSDTLSQIARGVLVSFRCDYPASVLTEAEVLGYLARDKFVEGGQAWLTDGEYKSGKALTNIIKGPSPLLKLVDFLREGRVTVCGLTINGESEGDISNALKKCAWVDFQSCKIEVEDFLTFPFFYTFLSCTFTKSYRLGLRDLKADDIAREHAKYSQIFRECVFVSSLVIDHDLADDNLLNLFGALIVECEFESLLVRGIRVKNKLIAVKRNVDNPNRRYTAANISFMDVTFESDFELSGMVVDDFIISYSTFLAKVDCKHLLTKKFLINNCNCESSFNLDDLHSDKLKVSQTSFNHFCSIQGAIIGVLNVSQASFQYSLNASDVIIENDLALHGAVFNQPSNFLGITFSKQALKQIDRETFRIIKHSFDSVGNHIEANRFYAFEMEAYRRELSRLAQGWSWEKMLLGFNALVSNHGQSYWRPMAWIIGALVLLNILLYMQQQNWLYQFCKPCNACFGWVPDLFNGFVRNVPLFKHLTISGIEFLSLLIGLFISAFIWQALVAFRRHAKR